MSFLAALFSVLKPLRSATSVLMGSPLFPFVGRISFPAVSVGSFSGNLSSFTAVSDLPWVRFVLAFSGHLRGLRFVGVLRWAVLGNSVKTVLVSIIRSNMPLNLVRFALWTLRDKAAQRRLALR